MNRLHCADCFRPKGYCYCHTLSTIDNLCPIHIIQHPSEHKHPIGTARIAQLSLSRCQTTSSLDLETLFDNKTFKNAVLIYPGEQSQSLDKAELYQDNTLLFIDSNWRKSKRILAESPRLSSLPRCSLPAINPSNYRIRKQPNEKALSTLEAITLALSIVEKEEEKFLPLLHSMDWVMNQQITRMGDKIFKKNYPKP